MALAYSICSFDSFALNLSVKLHKQEWFCQYQPQKQSSWSSGMQGGSLCSVFSLSVHFSQQTKSSAIEMQTMSNIYSSIAPANRCFSVNVK